MIDAGLIGAVGRGGGGGPSVLRLLDEDSTERDFSGNAIHTLNTLTETLKAGLLVVSWWLTVIFTDDGSALDVRVQIDGSSFPLSGESQGPNNTATNPIRYS